MSRALQLELSTILRGCCLALGCTAALGCAPTVFVALPSNDAMWIDDFTSKATKDRVTVEARTRARTGAPLLDLGERATPVLVRVENDGSVPIRISRDVFELVSGTARFRTVAPDQIASPYSDLPARELPAATLAPGTSASGLLYFQPVVGFWGFTHLRTTLVDATEQATIGTIDVPFGSGYLSSCTLASVDREEPRRASNILFRTCLPSP